MKRIALALLLIAVLIVAGCGDAETVTVTALTDPTTTTPNTTITTTSETDPTVDTIVPSIAPDFRNIKWGMSREEVRSSELEGALLAEDDDQLLYEDIIITGLEAYLSYLFNVDDQVFGANYGIIEQHTNETAYITDFNNIKSKLMEKYGTPVQDDVVWLDDLWKDDPSDWGMAIITGDLYYYTKWEYESLTVLLLLAGDNFDIKFRLMYQENSISDDRGKSGTEGL